jgi:hypothetical protein
MPVIKKCKSSSLYLSELRRASEALLAGSTSARTSIPVLYDELRAAIDLWQSRRGYSSTIVHASDVIEWLQPAQAGADEEPHTVEMSRKAVMYTDSSLKDVATLLALFTDRSVVACDAAIDQDEPMHLNAWESVLLLTWQSALTSRNLQRLSRAARSVPLGVIAAGSLEEMSFAVAKTLSIHIDTALATERADDDLDASILGRPNLIDLSELAPEELGARATQAHGLFAASGHGQNIDVLVAPGSVLCGRRQRLSWDKQAPHTCEAGPDRCTRQQQGYSNLISVDSIDSVLLYVSSCVGVATDGSPYPDNLLLRNATTRGQTAAFMSSTTLAYTHPLESAFVEAALMSGRSLGEAAASTAAFIQTFAQHDPGLLLLGDPEIKLARAQPDAGDRSAQLVRSGDSWDLNIRAPFGRLTEVHIPLADCVAAGLFAGVDSVSISFAANTPNLDPDFDHSSLRAAASFAGDGLRVVVINPTPSVRPLALTWKVTARRPVRDLCASIERGITTLGYLARMGQLQSRPGVTNTFLASINAASSAAEPLPDKLRNLALSRSGPTRMFLAALAGVQRTVQQVHETLLADAASWRITPYFSSYYGREIVATDCTASATPCPYCGSPGFVASASGILRPDIVRKSISCMRCTVLFDAPSDAAEFEIECDPVFRLNRGNPVRLKTAGVPEGALVRSATVLLERRDLPWVAADVSPGAVHHRASLPEDLQFNVMPSVDTPPGAYFLIAIVMIDMAICVATRPLQLLR